MSQPFFSIVMPAYNAEASIANTIESILLQDWEDFELIIVNDGSNDSTEKILDSYAIKDNRIKAIKINNGGPGNARNIGIQNASGQYLYLMDSDDGLPKGALKKYVDTIKSDKPDLIVSSYQLNVMDHNEVVQRKTVAASEKLFTSNEEFLKELYPLMNKQLMYVIWNKVYRMDIVKKNKVHFPPYSSCEDRLFNIAYFHHVEKVKIISDSLYHYSFEGRDSLTNKFLENKFNTFVEFYISLRNLTKYNLEGTSALFLKGVMSCIIPIHSSDCHYSLNEKKAYINGIVNHVEVKKAVGIASNNSLMRKVLNILFSSRNVTFVYVVSKLMYWVSNTSPKLIERLKGSF